MTTKSTVAALRSGSPVAWRPASGCLMQGATRRGIVAVASALLTAASASVLAQSAPSFVHPGVTMRASATRGTPTRYQPARFAGRAGTYYGVIWGVDSLSLRTMESGQIIRFAYRVLDADRATVLNDPAVDPYLVAPGAGVVLVVPQMDNIGKLRQTGKPEAGKSYWVAFSNKGRLVKPGDRVNVVIGQFHADGLVVD